MNKKIFLIRHGESISDVKGRYDGEYDDSLTESGRENAERVAEKLSHEPIDVIFSSVRIRAKETADILNEGRDLKIVLEAGLNERDIYGAFPELAKDLPEEEYRRLGELLADREGIIPGVESYSEFRDRVGNAFSEILKSGYSTIVIITHGGPIRSIFRDVLKLGEFKEVGNGAIIKLEVSESGVQVTSMDSASLNV
ncbi:MAG: histidine phosphatase family protein [Candidatus Moraniibacteriota bacterium]